MVAGLLLLALGSTAAKAPALDGDGSPDQCGWVGDGFARLWVDAGRELAARLNFPLTPPGVNALLREFEQRVYADLDD